MSSGKIEAFWKDATADDVAKIANTRKSIPARFRDSDSEDWTDCSLVGWKLSKHLPDARWIDSDCAMWNLCQVYREPDWHANKPDPGSGYRLLGKFPAEALTPGDELWLKCNNSWEISDNACAAPETKRQQEEVIWYRRRIEPVQTTRQFDRRVALQVGDRVHHPSGFLVVVTEKGFEVMP